MSEATAAAATAAEAPATPAAKAPVPGAITNNGFSPPEESSATSFLARMRAANEAAASSSPAAEPDAPAVGPDAAVDTSEDATEASEGDTEEPAEAEEAPKKDAKAPAVKIEDLKKLASDGEYEKLLKALDVDPAGHKVPSSRYAEFRKWENKRKAAITAQQQAVEKRASEVDQRVNAVIKEYDGFAKAKKAWDDGDVVGAIEAAFGESFDDLSEKAVKQKLAQDPELLKLKRKLEAKEKAEQEAQAKAAEDAKAQAKAKEEQQYVALLGKELKASEDESVSAMAEEPDFAIKVYRAQLHFLRTEGIEVPAEEAAQRVIEVLRQDIDRLGKRLKLAPGGAQSTVSTVEAGTAPLNTSQAGKSPENQRKQPKGIPQARAKAVVPTAEDRSKWSEEQRLDYYKKLLTQQQMEQRLGVKSGE